MLNESEIVEFRNKVSNAHHRRTFKRPVHRTEYRDGPLDGLRLPADEPPGNYHGWCHPTDRGPVLALYVGAGEPNVVRFLKWSTPRSR